MKLWQKTDTDLSEEVEQFTVGSDREYDLLLAASDVQATIAHVTMLGERGLMTLEETGKAIRGLHQIQDTISQGTFNIEEGVEDVHSQIEWTLTRLVGDTGKKIHMGRSRNDQVAVAIKLFLRDQLKQLTKQVKDLFDLLLKQSEANKYKLIPGYTHLQLAMPSSAGLWLSAYAESLIDDLEQLSVAYKLVNKNPLGSGAGYGSGLPLDRRRTTELLGFDTLNWNSVYAQMTRGKTEKVVSFGLASLGATLSKLSMDCCLYLNQNFGFISFPDELTTGSSIMPHKKNPDVFELIRAKCNRVQAIPNELTLLINNLPSGYHRDMQLTKEILFPAIETLSSCLNMMYLMMQHIRVTDGLLSDERYKYLFSVEAVNQLVKEGRSFRDAYREIGDSIANGTYMPPPMNLSDRSWHEGSIGNLCLEEISREMDRVLSIFQ